MTDLSQLSAAASAARTKSQASRDLAEAMRLIRAGGLLNLRSVLPLMLSLKGEPFRLTNHFVFEPWFKTRLPQSILFKTARQVGKSQSLAAQSVIQSACLPHFNTLMVCPLFEMIRRLSTNYVKPLVMESPIRPLLLDSECSLNVLQRSFRNHSTMFFSFAFLDANRIRGISADKSVWYATQVPVVTPTGYAFKTAKDIRAGDFVLSSRDGRTTCIARVLQHAYHGRRRLFRFVAENGSSIALTAESYLATDGGWTRAEDLIERIHNTIYHPAKTLSAVEGTYTQLGEVPRVGLAGFTSVRAKKERLLRSMVECFPNTLPQLAKLVSRPDLSGGSNEATTAGSTKGAHDYLTGLCELSPIVRVEVLEDEPVYDFAVEDTRCFFGGGALPSNCAMDELQDVQLDLIPIIMETMSASRWKFVQYTGTPKTLAHPTEVFWIQSSQAEWFIPCTHCGYMNIPALEYDLEQMHGPETCLWTPSEETPGVCCAKCQKWIYPRQGRWVHRYKERANDFAGYHVPQLLMPAHYADPLAWRILQGKRRGAGNMSYAQFVNECLGESFDVGARLITLSELKRAAVLPAISEVLSPNGLKRINDSQYPLRILSVDWGGGGEDTVGHRKTIRSYTVASLVCQTPNGRIHVPFAWRSLTPHDHNLEARYILQLMAAFRCHYLVHDYNGAGDVRETMLVNAGLPLKKLIPVCYVPPGTGPLVRLKEFNSNTGARSYHQMDKARSLTMTCQCIRYGHVFFFAYDWQSVDHPGLLHDFLSLVENMIERPNRPNVYAIIRDEKAGPDDFAQSVNMGTNMIWYLRKRLPDLGELMNVRIDPRSGETLFNESLTPPSDR